MGIESFLKGAGESALTFGAKAMFADKQAEKAHNRNVDAYRNRHQWEVQDLIAAGLNPILSATQGAGGVPASAQAMMSGSFETPASSANEMIASANEKEELVEKIKAETQVQTLLSGKTAAEIDVAVRQALKISAETGLLWAQQTQTSLQNMKESVKTKFAMEHEILLKAEQVSKSLGIEVKDFLQLLNIVFLLQRGKALLGKGKLQVDPEKYGIYDKGTGEILNK